MKASKLRRFDKDAVNLRHKELMPSDLDVESKQDERLDALYRALEDDLW